MFASFRYLDGPRAGESRTVGSDFATIGRHPGSDLAFDPERDLEVSIRHAAVFRQGGTFMVRDLGSSNGTFQNGKPVRGDRPLAPGDTLQFGPTGPRVEFRVASVQSGAPAPAAAPVVRPSEIFGPRTPTTERIRVAVRKQTRPWKWIAAAAIVVGVGAGSGAAWRARQIQERLEEQRNALLGRIDALVSRLDRTRATGGLQSALRDARRDVVTLRTAIAAEEVNAAELDTLGQEIRTQGDRHQMVIAAVGLDPAVASAPSRPAIAVLVTEYLGGRTSSGTAFAVRRLADTVWLATARHLVLDTLGIAATRLAVIFNGTGQVFTAHLVANDETNDLALVRAVIRGGAPVVQGLSDSLTVGDPVAVVGFPAGLDALGDWRRNGVQSTSSTGTVTEVQSGIIAIEGYGTHGSSGSPVLSRSGAVLAVISGRSTQGRSDLLAAPAAAVRRLLAPTP